MSLKYEMKIKIGYSGVASFHSGCTEDLAITDAHAKRAIELNVQAIQKSGFIDEFFDKNPVTSYDLNVVSNTLHIQLSYFIDPEMYTMMLLATHSSFSLETYILSRIGDSPSDGIILYSLGYDFIEDRPTNS